MKEIRDRSPRPKPRRDDAAEALRRVDELMRQIDIYRDQLSQQDQRLNETRAQLRESFSRYNELHDLSPVGFLTLNRKGCITELNEKTARLLGFPLLWLLGRAFMVFVAKPDIGRFLAFLTRSLQHTDLQTIEIDLFVASRVVPVQISLRTSSSNGGLIHRMTLIDLTNIKKVENQLQDALENWTALVQNAPDVIMTLKPNGRIAFVNRPVWGCSVPALVGTSLTDYVSVKHRPQVAECINRTFAQQERTTCEVNCTDDDEAWFSFIFGPTQKTTTTTTSTVMIREISEHKRAEEMLRSSGEQLREFAAREEAVREEERARLAREIHDELGQSLTVLKLDLSWLRSKTFREQKAERQKLNVMMRHVDETIDRVRRIASALRPSILDDLGLAAAIEWQLSEYQERAGIRCHFESNTEKLDVKPEISAAIFRVVQEAMTNVVRHAKASNVHVGMTSNGGILTMAIRDNGKGITAQQMSDLRSLGIAGMKERITRIGGQFNIKSRPGKGTRVEIEVPLHYD